jgi:hypothetical protein
MSRGQRDTVLARADDLSRSPPLGLRMGSVRAAARLRLAQWM